ncbi:hypothetical protein BGW80DRAFT_633879 [Lactifluus volemus]|nr:hypothetical protein BGW80DRAFT_633879 [Lactifluus volemus]
MHFLQREVAGHPVHLSATTSEGSEDAWTELRPYLEAQTKTIIYAIQSMLSDHRDRVEHHRRLLRQSTGSPGTQGQRSPAQAQRIRQQVQRDTGAVRGHQGELTGDPVMIFPSLLTPPMLVSDGTGSSQLCLLLQWDFLIYKKSKNLIATAAEQELPTPSDASP